MTERGHNDLLKAMWENTREIRRNTAVVENLRIELQSHMRATQKAPAPSTGAFRQVRRIAHWLNASQVMSFISNSRRFLLAGTGASRQR